MTIDTSVLVAVLCLISLVAAEFVILALAPKKRKRQPPIPVRPLTLDEQTQKRTRIPIDRSRQAYPAYRIVRTYCQRQHWTMPKIYFEGEPEFTAIAQRLPLQDQQIWMSGKCLGQYLSPLMYQRLGQPQMCPVSEPTILLKIKTDTGYALHELLHHIGEEMGDGYRYHPAESNPGYPGGSRPVPGWPYR